jgi:ring-1,2-phenylacetyl-CoA epoxidase subunit PaaB
MHAGSVPAANPIAAMAVAKTTLNAGKIVYNIWAIRTDKIRFTTPEEKDLWVTLPEKKFRDASEYKGGDKLKNFLEKTK